MGKHICVIKEYLMPDRYWKKQVIPSLKIMWYGIKTGTHLTTPWKTWQLLAERN